MKKKYFKIHVNVKTSYFKLRMAHLVLGVKEEKSQMHLTACQLKNVPLTVQFCAQTTWPSGSSVWLGGKFKLMLKEALAPVKVGPSFFKSNVT